MNKFTNAVLTMLIAGDAFAYEIDTHALMTSYAFERSSLASTSLATRMALDRLPDDGPNARPFSSTPAMQSDLPSDGYFDVELTTWLDSLTSADVRVPQSYDHRNMYSKTTEFYREDGAQQYRAKAWLMRGAIREDDLPLDQYSGPETPDADPHGDLFRVFHHFYDPVNDSALLSPAECVVLDFELGCVRSPDWAFGGESIAGNNPDISEPNPRNHFSWRSAREALWCALTRNNDGLPDAGIAGGHAARRRICWTTVLDSLGHIVHLLKDSAQPQHVRNDPHNKSDEWPEEMFNTTTARRTFETWTNYRTLEGKEITGEETSDSEFLPFFREDRRPPINVGSTYPIPRFSEPQYYFTTRQVETATSPASLKSRRGLADFTNRSFFSEGTIFSGEFPLPPSNPGSQELAFVDRDVKLQIDGEFIEREFTTALVDPLKGNYVDDALVPYQQRVPLMLLGLWSDFDSGKIVAKHRAISLDQYSAHADVLIPRAIAYSAGLIDYFFRGKLEITPPLDGLFSVIDHGTPHSVNANGYPIRSDDSKIFGFTKLRLRVRNATDVVNESGTNLPIPRDVMSTTASAAPLQGDPTLVAVARYHRNPCYKPDLSGERRIAFDGVITEPTGCGTAGTRTPFQELSVSKPVASNAAALNGAGQDLVFDFGSQPIPVNATDLAIQVVYRGPLGLESDAIAVGAFDIREPTYLTHWNNTDYAACNGTWAAHGATPPGCIAEGVAANRAILTTRLCVGTQLVFEHLDNTHGSLGVGAFVRLATLLDDKQKPTRSRSVVHDISKAEIRNRSIVGQVRQSTKEQPTAHAPFVSEPLWRKRGFVGSSRPLPYYQISGADLQPPSDAGAMDIGALTNPIAVAAAPDPGTVVFPDVAVSNMACTVAGGKAVFADELAYETGRSH